MFSTPFEPQQSLHYPRREKNQVLSQRKSRNEKISVQILSDLSAVRENTNNSLTMDSVQRSETKPNNYSSALASLEEVKRVEQKNKNLYQWFDEYNTHPEKEFCKLQDIGSPYLLHNSSSNGSPYSPENAHLFARGARCSGSSGEYRSVIDDLTIENKRLRKELRRYKNQTSRQLENDKLFEIRIHALPPDKRRELENTLSSFTSSLNSLNGEPGSNPEISQNGNLPRKFPRSPTKISSSTNTRTSHVQESSFILTTNSTHPTSVNQDTLSVGRLKSFENNLSCDRSQSKSPDENVSEIPSKCGLENLTKNQKKKLVVQRLEQLFTGGRGSNIGGTSDAWNQQEISSSAPENQSGSSLAGAREANMGPTNNQPTSQSFETPSDLEIKTLSDISEDSNSSGLDQRPTRPLDLDPDRAQVPSENLDYIRHLGFSTPRLASDESTENPNEKGRWVYLNLLINMAQLHMINVTADFVRSAIKDDSRNFKISKDGQMLLWKGGNKETSSESDEGSCTSSENENLKFLSPDHNGVQGTEKASTHQHYADSATVPNGSLSVFQYKPLVYRRAVSENSSQSDSLLSRSTLNHSLSSLNNLCQSQSCSNNLISSERKLYEEGSMIFYSGVNFYTDLSGDRDSNMFLASNHISDGESDNNGSSIESPASEISCDETESNPTYQRFEKVPVSPIREDNMNWSESTSELSKESSLDGFCLDQLPVESQQTLNALQQFETSGIGETQSSDLFAIRVLTCRFTVRKPKSTPYSSGPDYIRPGFMRRILRQSPHDPKNQDHNISKIKTTGDTEKCLSQSPPYLPQSSSLCRDLPVQIEIIASKTLSLPPSTLHS